jgi:ribonucleotide reductase beta subunit family protein with ferritin-like domain
MDKFKTLKVFEVLDMPEEIYEEYIAYNELSNDSAKKFHLDNPYPEIHEKVAAWLLENGAEPGETVMLWTSW